MATDQLARVRALLTQAEDPGATEPERIAFHAKAAKLMARHGIDKALAYKKNTATDERVDKVMTFRAPHAKAHGYLYAKVLGAMRIRVILKDDYKALHVFGFRSDLELAEMMHHSLSVQALRDLAKTPIRPANHAGADVRSFYYNYAAVVAGRLRGIYAAQSQAAQEELDGTGTSVALVLADRESLVDKAVSDAYPRLRKTKITYSGRAGADGAAAGRRADLGVGSIRNRQALTRPA
jgi:hypothetical protein